VKGCCKYTQSIQR